MTVTNAAVGGAVFRGFVPTLYSGDGALAAFTASRDLLARARPQAVQVHTWEPGPTVDALRALLPGVRIVVGVGVDSIAREAAKGTKPEAVSVRTFRTLADRAASCGADAIVWNAEAAWKRPPTSSERARVVGVVRAGLAAVASRNPQLLQWHTAYDCPHWHSAYPWEAWLGAGSPVLASLPQVYAAAGGEVMAHRGALPAREARALSSWATAVRKGWIRPDAPDGDADLRDVDWLPYVQLHHVQTRDTVDLATRYPLAFGWALPTRADAAGREAFLVASALHRLGHAGPDAVRAFQTARLLVADGILGPATTAAALSALDGLNATAPATFADVTLEPDEMAF